MVNNRKEDYSDSSGVVPKALPRLFQTAAIQTGELNFAYNRITILSRKENNGVKGRKKRIMLRSQKQRGIELLKGEQVTTLCGFSFF